MAIRHTLAAAAIMMILSGALLIEGCLSSDCSVVDYLGDGRNRPLVLTVSTYNVLPTINRPELFTNFINNGSMQYRIEHNTNCSHDEIGHSEACPIACYTAHEDHAFKQTCVDGLSITRSSGCCSWRYKCDYEHNRLPQYIWRAECISALGSLVYYPVPVLKSSAPTGSNPFVNSTWSIETVNVPVACTCI